MRILLIFLMAILCCACSEVVDPSQLDNPSIIPEWVMGSWQFTNDKGEKTTVTLYPDGSAIGTHDEIGSWYYIDNNIHLTWVSGWMNLIKKTYKGYVKLGFAPGVATDDSPTNESEAVKTP